MNKIHFQAMTSMLTLLVLIFCFPVLSPSCPGQEKLIEQQQLRRGRLLRTENRQTERTENFECQMLANQGSFAFFQMRRKTLLTHNEVQIYEAVSEVAAANKGEGITIRGSVDYVVVPGRFIEGETITREEWIDNGPMAGAKFDFLGQSWQTDQEGQIIDTAQILLKKFDDLRVKEYSLIIQHETLGSKTMTITRNLLSRQAGDGSDRSDTFDLLDMLGLDFLQHRLPGREGLVLQVSAPGTAAPGEVIKVTVTASNDGQHQVSSLMGRTFSRLPWLHGQMFYLGGLKPGEKRSFIRLFTVPEDYQPGPCYLSVGFWDVLGTLSKQAQNIKIEVK